MRAEEKNTVEALHRPTLRTALGFMIAVLAAALFITAAPVATPAAAEESDGASEESSENGDSNGSEDGDEAGEDEEPLPLDLPNPVFAGTPQDVPDNVRIDRRRLGKRRPQFMAPAGVENVAEGKEVTSSDDFPIIGNLELVTDGDKEALDGRFVELAPGEQHVTIDLEDSYAIHAIVLWHNHMDPRVYRDVIVQVADNEDFDDPKTIYNNDNDDSLDMGVGEDYEYFESDEGELVDAEGVEARYVRLWSNGSTADDQNHYTEVEVWALPADEE